MDLKRFNDFKPKFQRRLEEEFDKPFYKTKASDRANSNSPAVLNGNRVSLCIRTPTSSQVATPSEKEGRSLQSSVPSKTQKDPKRPSAESSSLTSDPELLKAFTTANNHMKTFYQSVCKVNADGLSPKSFKPGELSSLYNETKTNASRIIIAAAKGDQEVLEKLLSCFDSANFFNLQKLSIERTQLERAAGTVEKIVQNRFEKLIQDHWASKNFEDASMEELPEDLLELELIRSYGAQWETYYQKLKAAYAEKFNQCVLHLKKYQKHMTNFLDSALCVDIKDFERTETEVLLALEDSLGDELKKNVTAVVEDMRTAFKEQVILNTKREKASVGKAVEYACDKFIHIFGAASKEHEDIDLDYLHSSVFKSIQKCFESVGSFEYTKMWKMPQLEPERVKEFVRMAQELKKLKRVVSIKEKAASLLSQLEPEHRQQFFREAFPSHDNNQGVSAGARTENCQIETIDVSDDEDSDDEPQRKKTKKRLI